MNRFRSVFLIFSSLMLPLSGCQRRPAEPAPTATPAVPSPVNPAPTEHETLPAGPVDDVGSIFDLDLDLTDQDGVTTKLASFRGRPFLISLFYGTCPNACPLLISDLKRVERGLSEAARREMRVLLVSIDPETDTVARLAELATTHHVDQTRWRLTHTNEDSVRDLAAVLGVKYRRLGGGGFNHSSVIVLVDRQGVIAERIEGLQQPADALIARAEALLKP